MEHLFERASYKNYQNTWSKKMFDRVTGFDPSPDKRYEVWLLDTIKKECIASFETNPPLWSSENSTPEMKEFTRKFNIVFFQNMLLDESLYSPYPKRHWWEVVLDKLGLNINTLPEDGDIHKKLSSSIDSSESPLLKKGIFRKYILTTEDVPALMEALKIHRWASESNKISLVDKNIANIKWIPDLLHFVQPLRDEYEGAADTLNLKGGKGYEGEDVRAGKDFIVLGKDDKAIILRILTFLGSEFWACKGTSWCVRGGDYRKYGSERYFNNTYTDRGKGGHSPAIYYIGNEEGKKTKLSFFEGPNVQYRTPDNKALTYTEMLSIPEEHKRLLAKHLWIFAFFTGETKLSIDYAAYVKIFGSPEDEPIQELKKLENELYDLTAEISDYSSNHPVEDYVGSNRGGYVYNLIDIKPEKKWDDMTPAEQKFFEGFWEIVNAISEDWDYDALRDKDIGDYIYEKPAGTDEDGEPVWSDEQREKAEQNYIDKEQDYATEELYDKISRARISSLEREFHHGKEIYELLNDYYKEAKVPGLVAKLQKEYDLKQKEYDQEEEEVELRQEEFVKNFLIEETYDNNWQELQKNYGGTERLGTVFVKVYGYKKPSEFSQTTERKRNMIENLLRRFK